MTSSRVCVDASFLLRLVVAHPASQAAERIWEAWHRDQRVISAPALLFFEVTNVLHRHARLKILTAEESEEALRVISGFAIEVYQERDLHLAALQMARRFDLAAAYDAHYLALASALGAELWTADAKLVRAVHPELEWIRLLSSESPDVQHQPPV